MRRLWLAAFAWTAAHGHGDFSFDALPLIFCTLTYPAGDKIQLPLAIKNIMLLCADLSPGISKHFANPLAELLWRERLYSHFLLKQIEEERSDLAKVCVWAARPWAVSNIHFLIIYSSGSFRVFWGQSRGIQKSLQHLENTSQSNPWENCGS